MSKPSWLFWLISVIALAWGGFGAFDFYMTYTGNEKYLQDFPPKMIGWIQEFPMWRVAIWAIGVGAGALGGLLMVLRNGLAVPVMWLGVAMLLIGFIAHDLMMANGAEMYGPEGLIASVIIVIVTVVLAIYAGRAKGQGYLR